MNLIKIGIGLMLGVAWCGGRVKEKGTVANAGSGSVEIDSIVLSLTQGSDGKERETGFRMDVDAGNRCGVSGDPMFTVYTCGREDQSFGGHSTAEVVLRPAPCYKGRFDLKTLQQSGGRIHIWPICYARESAGGSGYDLWDITNVMMTIYLRPIPGAPGIKAIGGPDGSLVWNMDGAGMLVLSSQSGNEADFYFDAKFRAEGAGN
jgi:hypothetical protein